MIEENETLQKLLKDKKERLNELESQTLTLQKELQDTKRTLTFKEAEGRNQTLPD